MRSPHRGHGTGAKPRQRSVQVRPPSRAPRCARRDDCAGDVSRMGLPVAKSPRCCRGRCPQIGQRSGGRAQRIRPPGLPSLCQFPGVSGIRTHNLQVLSLMLYQLSYHPRQSRASLRSCLRDAPGRFSDRTRRQRRCLGGRKSQPDERRLGANLTDAGATRHGFTKSHCSARRLGETGMEVFSSCAKMEMRSSSSIQR